jgi:hypothetical protein
LEAHQTCNEINVRWNAAHGVVANNNEIYDNTNANNSNV